MDDFFLSVPTLVEENARDQVHGRLWPREVKNDIFRAGPKILPPLGS